MSNYDNEDEDNNYEGFEDDYDDEYYDYADEDE